MSGDKISLISQPAQLQPRPPVRLVAIVAVVSRDLFNYRKNTAIVPRHKCVLFTEPFLYPDPLGGARDDLGEFYRRVSELSQLEEVTVKWEELQHKSHCKPSHSNSRLTRRPSSERQPVVMKTAVRTDDEASHSIPPLVVTETPSKLESPTDYLSNPNVPNEDHSGDHEGVVSPTHSESNSSEPMSSAPVVLTNGKLSNSDCQQARHHLRRSMSQDHVSPRKTTKSHRKLPQRSGSATLLTESSSTTSVSSTCSERYTTRHHRANSNKKKHKKRSQII